MKPPYFTYHDPRTLGDALKLMATLENTRPLAGGQSLMPMLNFRLTRPDHLIDLNLIAELKGIQIESNTCLIGAMTRQAEIEQSEKIRMNCPLMAEAILEVGHRQTRNRGTIGGSLSHLDPSAELPLVLMALDAKVTAQSHEGKRSISIHSFPVSYLKTQLKQNELLTQIEFPIWPVGHGYAFEEFARRRGDFAIVAVAVMILLTNGKIARCSLVAGGIDSKPIKLLEIEKSLINERPSHELAKTAADLTEVIFTQGDVYASAVYRKKLLRTLTTRALIRAFDRAITFQ